MAKRRPPSPTPPSPILRGEALRKRVATIRAQRTRETRSRRERLALANAKLRALRANAFEVCHLLLEETTLAEWSAERVRPEAYWDERWAFAVKRGAVAYEDLLEWRYAFVQNATIAEYFENRFLSIIVEVQDGRRRLHFTAAAARDYDTAMGEIEGKFDAWARAYGRENDEDSFTRVKALDLLIRKHAVHKRWPIVTKGRAEARELEQEKKARAKRPKRPRKKVRR